MTRPIAPTQNNVRSALSHCSPDLDRGPWVRILAAVKDALGEDGRDIAETWSQGGGSFDKTDFRDAWKSIKAGGKVTVATLWRMALDAGWKPDGEAHQETEAERLERGRKQRARAERAAKEKARKERQAATRAAALWKAALPAQPGHAYLERKQVKPVPTLREIPAEQAAEILGYVPKSDGAALAGRLLIAPVKIDSKLTTAELIDGESRKAA